LQYHGDLPELSVIHHDAGVGCADSFPIASVGMEKIASGDSIVVVNPINRGH
jgi:hypothetical protein